MTAEARVSRNRVTSVSAHTGVVQKRASRNCGLGIPILPPSRLLAPNNFRLARQPEEDNVPLLRRLDQHCWPCHLLLQSRRKVRDYGDGVADLLGYAVEQDFLAVGADLVEKHGHGPGAHQSLRSSELQSTSHFFHGHAVNRVRGVHVVKFPAVVAPSGEMPSVRRDLPFAMSAIEGNNVDLFRTGLIGHVCEPASVGRKLGFGPESLGRGGYYQERFAVAFQRQSPNVLSSRCAALVNNVFAIARSIRGHDDLIVAEQFLLRAAAVRRRAEKLRLAIAPGVVDDPFSVRRPSRGVIENRAKREASSGAASKIDQPNVAKAVVNGEGDA